MMKTRAMPVFLYQAETMRILQPSLMFFATVWKPLGFHSSATGKLNTFSRLLSLFESHHPLCLVNRKTGDESLFFYSGGDDEIRTHEGRKPLPR